MGRRAKKAPVSNQTSRTKHDIPHEHKHAIISFTNSWDRNSLSHKNPSLAHPSIANTKVQTKKRVTLAKRFKCPFCANEDVVECVMKLREGTGSLNCRICAASFQMPIHHLHEPIDVFSEWLDACEAAEKGEGNANGGRGAEDDGDLLAGSFQQSADGGRKSDVQEKAAYSSLGLDDSDDDSE
jgi:transcription elongation factor Elf1